MPPWFYLFVFTILYGAVWSYIGILKMLSLNAYVFDLGISAERGWQILHTNLGLHGYITTLLNSGIVFPMSPLTGSGNFYAMIIFQAFSIAFVGPGLYFISKLKGISPKVSLLVSVAFFLYFPVYGIMWFDFHYQVFFLPLFIFGYLLYLRKNYYASIVLFFLSGAVRYPYSIFPMVFAFMELILIYRKNSFSADRKSAFSMIALFAMTLSWTLLGFLFFGASNTIPHDDISLYTATYVSLWSRVLVILLFLFPLLFLPVLRLRWIVMALPAFFLFITSSYTWYTYPNVFQGQYVTGVVPFLFLGLIDYLATTGKKKQNDRRVLFRSVKSIRKISSMPIIASVIVILIFRIVFLW